MSKTMTASDPSISTYEQALKLGGRKFADYWQELRSKPSTTRGKLERLVVRSFSLELRHLEWLEREAAAKRCNLSSAVRGLFERAMQDQGAAIVVDKLPTKPKRRY